MKDVTVDGVSYGNLRHGQLTSYKPMEQPIYGAICAFTPEDSVQAFAGVGVCGTPLPPPISPGYYTFQVLPASNGSYGFEFTKQ